MRRFLYRLGHRRLSINRLMVMTFAGLILVGALLLMLPFASRGGRGCGPMTAFFTATSATCVTGLVLHDTWTQFSGFGQAVILCLIETGGLGLMLMAGTAVLLRRGRIDMTSGRLMAQALGSDDLSSIRRMIKVVLAGSFLIQGCGALILTARFLAEYPFGQALRLGVFHAVSAFCNAGFDILGFRGAGASVGTYGTDPVVLLTLSVLVVLGGLGFLVWEELIRVRSYRRLSVYAKLVLLVSGTLILFGWVLFAALEWNNPETLGPMSVPEKLLASFFQSVTTRTAGFAGFDQGGLTDGGKGLSMFLMLIGGSSGSTAGGLKTVTIFVIALFMWSRMRGLRTVTVFRRTVPDALVTNALTIFSIMVALIFFGTVVICATSPVTFADAMYEAVSAIATVGLTTGITAQVSRAGKLLLMLYMFFGRVGVMTISLGFLADAAAPRYRYADTSLMIG